MKSVVETKRTKDLCYAAIQLSTKGFGNKNYGSITKNSKELTLDSIFRDCKVVTRSILGDKLEPGQLTPRRLCRFFRFQIQLYLNDSKEMSYLAVKYGDNVENSSWVFPGCEHLIDDEEKGRILLTVYKSVDERNNTKIVERIHRVLLARGIFKSGVPIRDLYLQEESSEEE